MQVRAVRRPDEERAVTTLLDAASTEPSGLLIEGEPGIGKTTLWSSAVEQAQERGFLVLSARAAAATSVMAYTALADLLADVDPSDWDDLPAPQRLAIDRILFRTEAEGAVTDQRAVAAAFLSVVERLADQTPVLIAVDDVQWLDPSTAHVVAFVARRLQSRVGVLGTVRTDPNGCGEVSWLQLRRPEALHRISLPPLSIGALHTVIVERLGRSLPRPTMVRIYDVSGGNPFYAIELARTLDDQDSSIPPDLPRTLAELVEARISSLDKRAESVLLATSCLSDPTVDLVARATGVDEESVVDVLEEAERRGVVVIDGHRLRFAHPLLASGVYTHASQSKRRAMHRRLADLVEQPELKARHLALAAVSADPQTLHALDAASEMAAMRGAPAAAAELLDLARGLGGDTPERRIRLAGHHFNAGDNARARALLEQTIDDLPPGPLRALALSLLGPVHLFGGSFVDAAAALERSLRDTPNDLALRLPTLVTLSLTHFNIGELDAAMRTAEEAVTAAERLGQPLLLSQALSLCALMRFLHGEGFDEASVRSAVEIEHRYADTASASGFQMIVRPSAYQAMLLSWSGQLDRAREEMIALRRSCAEHGLEYELMYTTYYHVQAELWRGNFPEAARLAEDGMERALQLRSDVALGGALTMRSALAAYAGNVQRARDDASAALVAIQRCGAHMLERWPIAILGFLEVSLGKYKAALTTLEPLVSRLRAAPLGTEIYLGEFVPDAVEAMIQLGRIEDAEPLIEMLERNGRRVDRPWMLAVGGRCRGMLLAARGQVDDAIRAAEYAMTEHDRLPMPFERARTQLVLGQLQRRRRQKDAAAAVLREALGTFESLDTPLWANRARAELNRTTAAPISNELTPSEQRVAELAASGMTYRDIAAALHISPKTVEANLTRIYRKLGIGSRAELGRVMAVSEATRG